MNRDPYYTLATLLNARGQDKGIYFTHEECSYLYNQITLLSAKVKKLEAENAIRTQKLMDEEVHTAELEDENRLYAKDNSAMQIAVDKFYRRAVDAEARVIELEAENNKAKENIALLEYDRRRQGTQSAIEIGVIEKALAYHKLRANEAESRSAKLESELVTTKQKLTDCEARDAELELLAYGSEQEQMRQNALWGLNREKESEK